MIAKSFDAQTVKMMFMSQMHFWFGGIMVLYSTHVDWNSDVGLKSHDIKMYIKATNNCSKVAHV